MDDKRGAPWLAIVLILLVVLPVLYVLSIGPVVWLVENDYLAGEPPYNVKTRQYKTRKYKQAWLATAFKPGAQVESAITGCRVTAKHEAPEPSQWEHFDGVQYFAPPPGFKIAREK